MEGATKHYGAGILPSETTVNSLKDNHLLRSVDLIPVKGRETPVEMFEVLDHPAKLEGDPVWAMMAPYQSAIKEFRARNWAAASTVFQQVLDVRSDYGPAKVYLNRCSYYQETPPPMTGMVCGKCMRSEKN